MDKVIELLKYILLAFVQGIAEIMPISSSGHLLIISRFLNIDNNSLSLEILLHLGSTIAIIFFFRKRLLAIIKGSYRYLVKKDYTSFGSFQLLISLIIATIPAAIVGLIFKGPLERIFSSLLFVGISLLFTSFIILVIKSQKNGNKTIVNYQDAFIIGLFQAIGVIPGISRSAITLSGAGKQKINREVAADFVFMLLIPIALGSGILTVFDLVKSQESIFFIPYIVAFIITIIVTYISLKLFLKLIRNGKIIYFAYYTFILGISVILLELFF